MYRIMYESGTDRPVKKGRGRRLILTGILFLVFCMVVYTYIPQGRVLLQTLLIPGEPETTLQAAEVFAAELGSGYPLSDAVRNFCSTVWENGYTG